MKVIVAGFSKTGTNSMNAALTELGYNVYDYLEHFMYHNKQWKKILEGKGKPEDFRSMYQNVDAVVDLPALLFWYEILQVFPDAKIILTTRPEESWFKSMEKNVNHFNSSFDSFVGVYSQKFLPITRSLFSHINRFCREGGIKEKKGWMTRTYTINKMLALQKYRKQNASVLKHAPKDKLLVFKIQEGWEPLCKFLDKKVPEKPFPHENAGGIDLLINDMAEKDLGKRIFQQLIGSIIVFVSIGLFIRYLLNQYPMWVGFVTFLCCFVFLFFIA